MYQVELGVKVYCRECEGGSTGRAQNRTSSEHPSTQPRGGKLRKLKILAATLTLTLAFAAPAFASVLGETEVELGPEDNEVRLEHEFLSETEVEVGNFIFGTNSTN